ncbi:LysR family transcriptional regulator [Bermanella sp. 47_1433_sub80_T6]|nr:LysR family transcriptional regulator [Bermanella sp. 47_1433_sub80_T6]
MKIDLNLFTVFEAIYSEGSLTQAAKRLNLTQPAISHALSRLRERLDDPLFERHGHKMRPTPLAQNLLPEVQSALSQLNQALQVAHRFDASKSDKTYCLALRDVIEATMLPPLMQNLSEQAPQVKVSTTRIDRKDMSQKLASGELDFAVDVLLPNAPQVKHQKIIEDELVVLVNSQLPQHSQPMNEDGYLQAKHIVVSSRSSGPDLVDYALSSRGLNRNIHLRCQQYYAACQVVANSDLVLTMPKRYALVLSRHFNNIEIMAMPIHSSNVDIHLYWHQSRDKDPASVWFRGFIQSLAGHWQPG